MNLPTIDSPDIPDTDRETVAAQQLHTAYRGTTNPCCAVVLSGREVGQVPDDECCQHAATQRVDWFDYRAGFSAGGVFSPAESVNTPVCDTHVQVMQGRPGFIRSRAIEVPR